MTYLCYEQNHEDNKQQDKPGGDESMEILGFNDRLVIKASPDEFKSKIVLHLHDEQHGPVGSVVLFADAAT